MTADEKKIAELEKKIEDLQKYTLFLGKNLIDTNMKLVRFIKQVAGIFEKVGEKKIDNDIQEYLKNVLNN